ncbi:GTP cyclohydrolase I FolE [Aggregatibacter actinomycetemcomitans]|uniref:GTP cyclohydrolase I FolE n=1 Tax=Aggregatibacter actinomycetemcomitans TaxID=714 RepID=UPI00022ADAD0|nr:GTP cyclohydrolase I FolE [Aggregatibacter actinomycetemcomitans]KOE69952.1 GTP cyclohydrolase [Aggregatibacter actinomycetemcomitans serotype f str. D18P1]KYK88109.1 GTP cyclohydrolase I [Aggregatibacter actinomycetemcomitans serotype f str. SC29R]MBN6061179.1 GTP cyclohydrolase I FolE [Aggregatibacter actinomycetemcomitans]OZV18502.1 GTP cyclohydrolase I FolE [Aggregatibacter actinomycetemcomitans]UEL53230.1 GTP cyclohydrolase I FolE [Aggregatibacter actinomycetemcomitans]
MNDISPEAEKVRTALVQKGIETPMIVSGESKDERRTKIEQHMREVLHLIGLDLRDDSIEETPSRLAKMFVDEIFSGLDYANFPKITNIANRMKVSEMVLVNDVTLTSTCEHHFVTIDGKVSVAYYPKKWVIGLSKINRIVTFFAQRPQVQERLTEQILLAFQTILETEDVAVYVKATHFCVKCRGIKDANSYTITSAFGGVFLEDRETRKEFLSLINK